jgi:glycosyltransferase involved in cell wall biosynthesis
MRITIVTGFFLPVPPLSGGATEKIWHGLAKVFAASGHSVTFVSRTWPGLPATGVEDGVRHVRLPGFNHTRSFALNAALDLWWGIRVTRALPAGDAVVCNTISMPVWLRRIRPSAGKVAVMIGRTPKGQTAMYGGVDRIYAPSTFVQRRISSPRLAPRVLVTGYPIEWGLHAGAAAQASPPVTVGYIGRLHPEKGIELLVRAAGRLALRTDLPTWRLRLMGPSAVAAGGGGPEWLGRLQAETARSLGDRVEWLPADFGAANLARAYGAIDVFCYPSLADRGETFGVSVAEAMAARCAPVVSALECFGDLVEDGRTGLVFDHSSPDAEALLADRIGRLIADAGLRNALALAGQAHVRRFDYPNVSSRILGDLSLLTGAGGKNV